MTTFSVTLKHDTHGEVTTHIELSDGRDYSSQYVAMMNAARKNAASRFVDYESFPGDSAYLDRLDTVAEEFAPIDARLASDAPEKRYSVMTNYRYDGTWSDWVIARSHAEACFIAAWTTAVNENADPAELEEFQEHIEAIEIVECYEEPVTKEELVETVREFYALGAQLNLLTPDNPTMTKAKQQLEAMGHKL